MAAVRALFFRMWVWSRQVNFLLRGEKESELLCKLSNA